jgi:hypothetical protein
VPGFQLSSGVVVDPERREAYVMNPSGGIVAVNLVSGAAVWRTRSADKPLTLSGELLVSQAEEPGPANTLRIVMLDPSRRGAQVTEALVDMPPGVQPTIAPSLNRSFTAEARSEQGEAAISWQFVEQPVRGIAPGPMEVLPGEAPPAASAAAPPVAPDGAPPPAPGGREPGGEATIVQGAARVDLSSGTVTPTEARPMPAEPGPPPVSAGDSTPASDLEQAATLPGVPQPQFLSADGRHVLSSQRVADDPEWDKYLWTIFERESRKPIGQFHTHLRYAPFFVVDTQVIYQTPPYARRRNRRMVQEPLQIRAVDLSTGVPVWSQPVRDTVDRQPPPP